MAGMGPTPKSDAQRRRRNAAVTSTRLPAEGRRGPVPDWPLDGHRVTGAELAVWRDLWTTPQAVMWERLGWARVIGRYVRTLVRAELDMTPGLLGEVRQLEDRLGLSPLSMLRLGWEIASDEIAEQREVNASSRARVRAVE